MTLKLYQMVRNTSPLELIGIRGIDSSVARTPEMGSRALVHAALSGTKEEVHGKYLNVCRVEEESDFVLSLEGKRAQDRLWVSLHLLRSPERMPDLIFRTKH